MMETTKGSLKYVLCFILLTILFLFSEFYFLLSTVEVKNAQDALAMYERAEMENGLYFSASGGSSAPYGEPDIAALEALPAVENVVYLNYTHLYAPTEKETKYYNVLIFPDSAIQAFPLSISEGTWLSDFPDTTGDGGTLNALVCGDAFRHEKIGSTLDAFEVGSDEPVILKVLGKLPEGVVLPHFGSFGSGNSTDQLFEVGNLASNYILMRERDFAQFQQLHPQFSGLACVILLNPDAGEEERSKTVDELFQTGRYCEFSTILAQGRKNLQNLMKSQIVIPVALLFISALSYLVLLLTFSAEREGAFPEQEHKLSKSKLWALLPLVLPTALSMVFAFRLIPLATEYILYHLFGSDNKQIWPTAIVGLLIYSVTCLLIAILILLANCKLMKREKVL